MASANARFLRSTSTFSDYRNKIAVANLFQKYGFPSSMIPSFLSRNPSILHSSLPQLHHSLNTLFSLRIPQNAVVSLLTTHPCLLHHSFHKTLQSGFPHLQTRFPTLPPSTLVRLLLSSTKFHLDPLQLSPKLHALKTNFAFSEATVASVLEGFPDVVVTSENEIASVIDFLAGLGIPRDEIDLVVRSFPRVLALGVEHRLMPLIREIKELGFSNREMRREISRDPRILGMEMGEFSRCLRLLESLKCRETIKERVMGSGLVRACFEVKLRVDCFSGYGLTRRDALKIIWKEPRVICYEVEDIERKIEFLVHRMKCGVECLAEVPKYLGVNFEKQIVARYSVVECLRGKGAIGFEVGLKDLVMPSRLRFYNLYVKPYPECEKIYGRFSGCGVQVKKKHPAGLWKLFKPQKFAERAEDVKNGVVGLLVGNENSSNEDRYVERLLDRISNGKLPEDRRNAIAELQGVVSESQAFQLAFGALGFPIMLSVLKEERDDVEMVRGALETLVSALTPINHAKGSNNEVQPALMNTDLLSREADCISLLLSLLEEDDFYVRYYTLQILTALLTNSPQRLQEAILTIPRGITRLVDMLMDREVIRNEALLLLTHLTREAEEIQKILVFEGAFEKIFSIIREEGNSDGGVVVQDCLELLNNLIRSNASNQVLLRETVGLDSLILILKLRGSSFTFNQQKTINLLSALETIKLLLKGGSESDPGKDMNKQANKTTLVQKNVLEHLLILGVESQWVPVAVRCAAMRCIGDLIVGDSKNRDLLASKVLGEEPQVEPALNSLLRILLRTSNMQEFIAADYIFKSFCEKNADGQSTLASTLIPQPYSMNHTFLEEDVSISFGSMLLQSLTLGENGDLETCCRAASVLSHILKDQLQCKERVLRIEIEAAPMQSLGAPEPLMHQIVKCLAIASSMKSQGGKSGTSENSYVQAIILKLLITWLADCPSAVHCFLDARPHLTYLLELVSNLSETVCIRGFAAVVLGECVIYNKSTDNGKDAFAIVDAISQKIGLSSYFLKFDEMQKSSIFSGLKSSLTYKSFTRSSASSMVDIDDDVDENDLSEKKILDHPILSSILDSNFVNLVKSIEADIREQIVEVYSRPKMKVAVVPAELEQRSGESDGEYIKRLKAFVEKQCSEIQDLVLRNATLAEDLAKTGSTLQPEQRVSGGSDRIQIETLRRDLQEASQRLEMLKEEKAKVESEAIMYRNLAGKMEADLRSLSDAYNSLEQSNLQLENEVKALKREGHSTFPDVEAIKAEAREEAQKESEGELNDLLVCLGQEQSKVDKLCARLLELGEDVDKLLEGIGDDAGVAGDGEDEEDEE